MSRYHGWQYLDEVFPFQNTRTANRLFVPYIIDIPASKQATIHGSGGNIHGRIECRDIMDGNISTKHIHVQNTRTANRLFVPYIIDIPISL
ncbi:hypothetical protein [Thalassotalea mangrovi]|uniref:Uncharacterized protein n=1 Tax=Thalassotalea mangrovi TaxID=2572245 RepID=A0A4U1B2S4_9GAMM|nr:hypothetical protein [Thalassotalea mangrovi]TKB43954.1 hypothetical protein E8M12_13330 [Thalassotalea mangrovi]